ncbi:hypothetical protein [Streptomyces sp. NPDC088847]
MVTTDLRETETSDAADTAAGPAQQEHHRERRSPLRSGSGRSRFRKAPRA